MHVCRSSSCGEPILFVQPDLIKRRGRLTLPFCKRNTFSVYHTLICFFFSLSLSDPTPMRVEMRRGTAMADVEEEEEEEEEEAACRQAGQ